MTARDYLNSTLHDERGEFGHHKIHTFEAGLFEFEDLLFDYRLESQVRGEEPRSERSCGQIALCCGGRERERQRQRYRQNLRKEEKRDRQRRESRNKKRKVFV